MAQAFVTATIAAAPVVVFSKITCPYCRLALSVLDAAVKGGRAGYTVVELGERADGAAIQAYLSQLTGASTVPRVFVGGTCIGGGDDTAAKARSGELARLLAAAGVAA